MSATTNAFGIFGEGFEKCLGNQNHLFDLVYLFTLEAHIKYLIESQLLKHTQTSRPPLVSITSCSPSSDSVSSPLVNHQTLHFFGGFIADSEPH